MTTEEESHPKYLRVHETGEWEITKELQEATVFRMDWLKVAGTEGRMAIVPELPRNTPSYFVPRTCQYHLL